jgi:RNA polymerase sigma-70 factor (ECF subfamily)
VPTSANGLPAFGYYRSERGGSEWRAFAIQVLTLQDDAIASVTNFVDSRLFPAFGLPLILPRTNDR